MRDMLYERVTLSWTSISGGSLQGVEVLAIEKASATLNPMPTVFEICAGAGGQALGLEAAGFECAGAVELDRHACETLRTNRPQWKVISDDVHHVSGEPYQGVDLLAGGVPCPPFSIAGKQLGSDDERDLFPQALRLAAEMRPRAVMLENVPGFASEKFREYRRGLVARLK